MYKVYGCGDNPNALLGKQGNFKKFTLIEPLNKYNIVQISCGYQINFMLTDQNTIVECGKSGRNQEHKIPNETVVSICSGTYHSLALTDSGNVYVIRGNNSGQTCMTKTGLATYHKIPFFEKKNVIKVLGSYENSYFLCENGDYYGSGMGNRLSGKYKGNTQNSPKLLSANVKDIFSGPESRGHIFILNNDEAMGFGDNDCGQLGVGVRQRVDVHTKLKSLPESPIQNICMGFYSSALITEDGKLYATGNSVSNGMSSNKDVFTLIPGFENEFFTQISCGQDQSLAFTESLKIFAWGKSNSYGEQGHGGGGFGKPTEIKVPELESNPNVIVHCGLYSSLIYTALRQSSLVDFVELHKSGLFADSKINEKPCHKKLVEWRSGKPIDEVKKHLEELYSKEQSNLFLEWIYTNKYYTNPTVTKIANELGIQDIKKKKFMEDLTKLYFDEDSKDFNILVSVYDEEEGQEEEENEEDQEEIPVHKLILIARSGLFREMFQNITEESNSVQDFSGKSIESIEIFIKYLYTDKIELTADDDPQMIVEELADAAEYYQLRKSSNLNNELKKISKQFKL
ncbi:hypothetical protein M0812_23059 [Anaeramoeba flamelloides]|uniref:BTB domain-containing protein n=1 Tax=Anaeramoeba flamelloides TaxID=1746091 RepID=A0AAV7YRH2_9EUKA|nr:hypothetical protein M0812_23059 [Anaeramoeba flamelloides]